MATPELVSRAYRQLKLEYPFYVALSRINGKYYVYKSKSVWDKETKKVKTRQEYLGRITEDGTFIKKMKISQVQQQVAQPEISYKLSDIDEKLLTYLSMNCRLPLVEIAKRLGVKEDMIIRRKADLEKRFGIRYLASINYIKLGFSAYLVFVSFKDGRPSAETLKEIFENKPHVQLAMLTQGKYDLVLHILVEHSMSLVGIVYSIRKDERLKNYESVWDVAAFEEFYGYVPLRDKFFELLEKKVWHRTKDNPRPTSDSLSQREYALLRELNNNGNESFASIEKKYNFGQGSGRYTFDKLREKELIWRSTLTFQNYSIKYPAMILVTIINQSSFLNDRQKFLHYIIKDYAAPSTRFALEGDILASNGVLLLLPVIKDGELENELDWLKQNIGGIKLDTLVITHVILGELCYRRFDNAQSGQTAVLTSEYKEEFARKVNYNAE